MPVKGGTSPYYSLATTKAKIISPRKIRFVQRDVRLSKFLPLFHKIAQNARKYSKRMEERRSMNILKLLDKIIPLDYFGTRKHRKLFYKIVELILTRSVHECIYVRQLIRNYNLRLVPWLAGILKQNGLNSQQLCRRYFYEAQIWLLEKIVKPLILRFYSTVKKGQTYEIELVPKPTWTSFITKVINNLERIGHLIPTKTELFKVRGILQIRPKRGYRDLQDFRPIMRLIAVKNISYISKNRTKNEYKKIIKVIRTVAQKMCLTKTTNLYNHWKNYVTIIQNENLYGVKLDVKDAFGNVDIDTLCSILDAQSADGKISIHITNLITNHIRNQYVSFGRTKGGVPKMWQWKHGLLQGDRFSSALCQLYMSHQDAKHLKEFYKPHTFLHRTVDDYLFCSTNMDDIEQFIHVMNSVHILNKSKTESNLPEYAHDEIGYCGHIFVMKTKEVKGLYHFQTRTEIRHRFRLWNIQRPIHHQQQAQKTVEEFLKKSMVFSCNNYRFKNMELNTVFNNENCVLHNYFEAMIFLAFKFDAAFMAIYYGIKNFQSVTIIIKKTVYKYACKSLSILQKKQGQNFTGLLSLDLFLKIGNEAFVLVLKKRQIYKQHNILNPLMKYARKIVINNKPVNFQNFKKLPTAFNSISMQRRLPHHKNFKK